MRIHLLYHDLIIHRAALASAGPEERRRFRILEFRRRLTVKPSDTGSVPADMVSGHKWFNIAAMSGCKQAARLRHEIAAELSESEIAATQRAARAWVTRH
ncbi:MAG TPA: hypothetical protein VGI22_13635 [Xanthobacteraceae bacterium]|jgi:hypothetical protein